MVLNIMTVCKMNNRLTLSPDKQTIRATLKPKKGTVNIAS